MRINKVRFVVLVALIVMVTAFPLAVSANHSWGNYHWARKSNPFTLKIGDNVNASWDSYLNEAVTDWTASNVMDLTKVSGAGLANCGPVSGRVEVCNANYGDTGWLGIASVWTTRGTHIAQATAKMNDFFFNQPQYNTAAWRRLVMCQEVGHAFGLDHQDEGFSNPNLGTCMDYTNNPSGPPSNEHPNQHDFSQLSSIYTHLDKFTTISASTPATAPAGFANADMHAQENWGEKFSESADGRVALYVRDFGNGFKIFTFVIWAID